jgi:flagellar biosynthesis protein FlhG
MWHQNKRAISVGGGKGGIGKSCFASNLAIALTMQGRRVILVDTDIEAPNLHTFVGINYPKLTLDDYLDSSVKSINDIVLDTPIPKLQLISSAGSIMSLSGLKYLQRQRFFKAVTQLDTDVVIFDVAAGTNTRVVDYFSLAPTMVIMIEPVPTSMENAYMFLKNLMYRHLLRIFYSDKPTSKMILSMLGEKRVQTGQSLEELLLLLEQRSPKPTAEFRSFLASLNSIFLVINRVRTNEQLAIVDRFARVVKRYLMLDLHDGGGLPFEPDMDSSIIARTPFIIQHPKGKYAQQMEKIAVNLQI